MLTEIRKLIFPDDDLIAGILDHIGLRTSIYQIRGAETSLEIVETPDLHVVLNVHNQAYNESHSFQIKSEDLVRVMLRYCIKNKVPIPKNGKKGVEKIDHKLALSIQIDDEVRLKQDTTYFVKL